MDFKQYLREQDDSEETEGTDGTGGENSENSENDENGDKKKPGLVKRFGQKLAKDFSAAREKDKEKAKKFEKVKKGTKKLGHQSGVGATADFGENPQFKFTTRGLQGKSADEEEEDQNKLVKKIASKLQTGPSDKDLKKTAEKSGAHMGDAPKKPKSDEADQKIQAASDEIDKQMNAADQKIQADKERRRKNKEAAEKANADIEKLTTEWKVPEGEPILFERSKKGLERVIGSSRTSQLQKNKARMDLQKKRKEQIKRADKTANNPNTDLNTAIRAADASIDAKEKVKKFKAPPEKKKVKTDFGPPEKAFKD